MSRIIYQLNGVNIIKLKKIPRIILAAATSGSGKTSITMGLIRHFCKNNVAVYPFKIGPDYIDPGFHSQCAGRPCYNLDSVLMGEKAITQCLVTHSQGEGIAIIEGVMGLYDGKAPPGPTGSTSEVAKMTRTPVIVIIDAKGAAQTIGALALGIKLYDPDCPVAGFILNRVGSQRHFDIVKVSIEEATDLPALGWLPKNPDMSLAERHLGLVAAWEKQDPLDPAHPLNRGDQISALMKGRIDFEKLMDLANKAPVLEVKTKPRVPYYGKKTRIALAKDKAFHFYYQENLDILEDLGVQWLPFSPLKDSSLPHDIAGIYLGGGYPEIHAAELQANKGMSQAFREAAQKSMPILAECGGLMYLAARLILEEKTYNMAGIFDITIKMARKLSALGYYQAELARNTLLGPAGLEAPGHMFRWSQVIEEAEESCRLFKVSRNGKISHEGYVYKNTVASYLHLHFAGNPSIAVNFLKACQSYEKEARIPK